MSVALVNQLLESFEELNQRIAVTRETLGRKQEIPCDVLDRVDQYSEIVLKQKAYAHEMRVQIKRQNWQEVSRLVKLINGLSAMIREDATEILSGTFEAVVPEQRAQQAC